MGKIIVGLVPENTVILLHRELVRTGVQDLAAGRITPRLGLEMERAALRFREALAAG